MTARGDRIARAVEGFREAPFSGDWSGALKALAEAAGGHAAQLIGVGPRATVPFNIAMNIDPDALSEFMARDGGNPARNARVRHGLRARPLDVLTEADFGDVSSVLATELYADLFMRHDIPFTAQTTLMNGETGAVGLAVLYGADHGVPQAGEKAALAAIAPAAQAAVRLRLAIEGEGARLVAGGFEALQAAAFVCSPSGRVRAASPAAEALASEGRWLRIRHGCLEAVRAADAGRLRDAMTNARADCPLTAHGQVPVSSADGQVCVLEVAPLPRRDFALGLEASVLVVARRPQAVERLAPILVSSFGLTAAEAEICIGVADGMDLAAIARSRGVEVGTVRVLLKRATGKLGLSRQAELAAFVHRL